MGGGDVFCTISALKQGRGDRPGLAGGDLDAHVGAVIAFRVCVDRAVFREVLVEGAPRRTGPEANGVLSALNCGDVRLTNRA